MASVNDLPTDLDRPVKRVTITEDDDGAFVAEYDNSLGAKNAMRLEASTYEEAVDEIKEYLGITDDRDGDGNTWEID